MSDRSHVRGAGRNRPMFGRLVLALLLATAFVLAGYLGAYALARAGRWIVHASNHRHPHPEKRSPEHHVIAVNSALNSFFKPLRVLEERYHEAVNR